MNAPASNSTRRMTGGQALAEMLKLAGVGPMFGMGGFQLLPFYEACRALGLKHYPDQRRALRRLRRRRLCARDQPAGRVRRARSGRARPTWSPALVEVAQRRHADDRDHRRRQPRARLEEHDAGGAPGRNPAPRRQGADPRRGDQAHPRTAPPRLRGRDLRPARPGACSTCRRTSRTASTISTPADFWIDPGTLKAQARRTRPDPRTTVERAAALLAKAERPLLLVGGGIHISRSLRRAARARRGAAASRSRTPCRGKGAIACTHPLSAGLFGRYSRIANDLIAAVRLPARGRLQARRDRDQALRADARRQAGDPRRHRCRRRSAAPRAPTSRSPATRALALAGPGRGAVATAASARRAAPAWCAEVADAHGRLARGRRATGWKSNERPINVGRLMGELNNAHAGRRDPGRRRRLRRRTGAGCCSTPSAPAATSSPTAASPRSATALPGGIGAQLAPAPKRRVVGADRRRRLQHDARRARDRAPRRRHFVLCVFNNAASGYVKALQHVDVSARATTSPPTWSRWTTPAIARAMGCHGIRVEDPDKLGAALREGLANTATPDRPRRRRDARSGARCCPASTTARSR